jgi:DNA polymerase III sliding clamp (beta) subunit (PCNA family)
MHGLFDGEGPTEQKTPLKEALRLLRLVVPKATTLPILRSVCVHSDGSTVSMDGTNLDQWVHLDSVDISCPVGKWLVGFAKLSAGLPLEQLLEPENGDFPAYTKAKGDAFSATWIHDLPRVSFAMSVDSTRLSLNGVTVEPSILGATDGHRCAFVKRETGAPFQFILKSDSVRVLGRIKGNPESCIVDDRTIHIRYPWGFYGSKVEEGPYPNWRQLIRRHHTYKVQVPRKQVMDWCSQIPAARGNNAVDSLHLRIHQNHIQGIAAMASGERLDLGTIQSKGGPADTHPIVVGMDPQYLREIFSKFPGSTITLGICEPSQAVFLDPDSEDMYIQMPLRVFE